MKLEARKFYKMRNGKVIGPLYANQAYTRDTHPWRADGSTLYTWTDVGRFGHGKVDSGLDLVEEVQNPADAGQLPTVAPSFNHKYRMRNGEIVGPVLHDSAATDFPYYWGDDEWNRRGEHKLYSNRDLVELVGSTKTTAKPLKKGPSHVEILQRAIRTKQEVLTRLEEVQRKLFEDSGDSAILATDIARYRNAVRVLTEAAKILEDV
jgi:hypothetical protein